jgi:hypothetical protein
MRSCASTNSTARKKFPRAAKNGWQGPARTLWCGIDSHRLSRNHDEHHARWYCRLERRERHDATFYGTQEPAGGADKSLGRNRTGGLCANVHWVGNGFPAARSSILRVSPGA